jgi:hypothetical protein
MRTPVISLGAGVQSSAMLLMAARGELDDLGRPELAIFADTQHEPAATYEYLGMLRTEAYRGGIEVATVTAGDLLDAATTGTFNPIPLYVSGDGREAVGRRQCTKDFKLRPIRAEMRRRGFSEQRPVEMWIGISIDEAVKRMKGSGLKWVENRWPLVERQLDRRACARWLVGHGYPLPPKSACVFCPYKRDREFALMRDEDPVSFARAVAADEAMRDAGDGRQQFVSRSLVPLSELRTVEDLGQQTLDFGLEDAECEGMCGV